MATPDASTAIVAAMPEEVAALRARLSATRTLASPSAMRLLRGELAGRKVLLAVTGDGRARARRGLETLLARATPESLLFVGFSGALSPALRPGEVVVPTRIWDDGIAHEPPRDLLDWADAALGARAAVTITTERILLDASAKSAHRRAGEEERDAIVDIESGVWAELARRARIPWLAVRAISDGVEDDLPPLLDDCRAADGALDRRAVIGRALIRPSSWQALWTLRARSLRCAHALAAAVETLLASHPLTVKATSPAPAAPR